MKTSSLNLQNNIRVRQYLNVADTQNEICGAIPVHIALKHRKQAVPPQLSGGRFVRRPRKGLGSQEDDVP